MMIQMLFPVSQLKVMLHTNAFYVYLGSATHVREELQRLTEPMLMTFPVKPLTWRLSCLVHSEAGLARLFVPSNIAPISSRWTKMDVP